MANGTLSLDLHADGTVSVSGYPDDQAAYWDVIACGLTGYFRANGLLGPDKARARLDAFHELLAKHGIDQTGVESGVIQ